jgi:hypothetical protein
MDMKTAFKGILLVVGAFVATIAVAAFLIFLDVITLTKPYDCPHMNRALVILWVAIAVLFISSVVGVRFVAREIFQSGAGQKAVVVIYGMLMLASYVVLAFGLMVAFEC